MWTNDRFIYFWKEWPDVWYPAEFDVDVNTIKCHFMSAGHYFIYMKAIILGDEEIAKQILEDGNREKVETLGLKVQDFDSELWRKKCIQIMLDANVAKFSQNEDLKHLLLSPKYKGHTFVQVSPLDHFEKNPVYESNPELYNKHQCNIFNLIGKALNETRKILFSKERSSADKG